MSDKTNILEDIFLELTTDVVSAYVSNNPVPASDLPQLIADTHQALRDLCSLSSPVIEKELKPAVAIRRSVSPDFLICLEDGKKFKSLKRHLAAHHGLTPDEYRQKWNLPADYPIVAPNYSAARSALAINSGLGRKSAPQPTALAAPAPRERKKLGLKFS